MTITLRERYEIEREKRAQDHKGSASYASLASGPAKDLLAPTDPWVTSGTPVREPVADGGHCKILVLGAGIAGIVSAIQCLRGGAASRPSDILLVDREGEFGGTWNHSRYPGLTCDVESSLFLPLLEETGYIPRSRYPGGEEIRQYMIALATQFGLDDRTMFQSAGTSARWMGDRWTCDIVEQPKGLPTRTITVTADYMILCTGFLGAPRVPALPGLEQFQGPMMHPSSWRYDVTGGTPTEPEMYKLLDKTVALVGTSATSVQVMPELAKYAAHVYVFQRTPMACDARNNETIDVQQWKSAVANKRGWQRERGQNNQAFQENPDKPPPVNMTGGDGWAAMPSIAGLTGSSASIPPGGLDDFYRGLQALDDAWMDKVRERTATIVRDAGTAEKLKPWHACFCKPGTFSDSYLPAFNRPNVHLVDMDGRGLQRVTATGVVAADGTEYPVDVIVWATGYVPPGAESLADRGHVDIRGRDGMSMSEMAKQMELLTLHGTMAHGFPNLFMPGLSGAGASISQTMRLENQGEHIAYIISDAPQRFGSKGKVVIEPTDAAVDAWANEIERHAERTRAVFSCAPTALNLDGALAKISPETLPKVLRSGFYGRGYLEYLSILESWRAEGSLEGLDVRACA